MEVIESIEELRRHRLHHPGGVLVPTMGALHEGHLSLCDRAREESRESETVEVSIFVNPTQFGPGEDLDAYPRQVEEDLEACRSRGVDLVFVPRVEEIYHPDASTSVSEARLSSGLCGESRPGHFDGVCTVVSKLFNLFQPRAAVFGEKDYQQLAVIRRMVRDLNFPVHVVGSPTVREADGLAMSSRNAYLGKEERAEAPLIYRTLVEVRDAVEAGEVSTPEAAEARMRKQIGESSLARIDYVRVVHPDSLEALDSFGSHGYRLLAAVFFGSTRLIDNVG
jgi:pantoate--beta-alanine ligase